MDTMRNDIWAKMIRFIAIATGFILPLLFIRGFIFPGTFPRVAIFFLITGILLVLALVQILKNKEILCQKNWIGVGILLYIGVLLLSALASGHFEHSFFGSHQRMTGINIFIFSAGWFLVLATYFREIDWLKFFRATLFSGVIVAGLSYFGVFGLNTEALAFWTQGGSTFENTSLAGVFYLFAFLFGIILLIKDRRKWWRVAYFVSLLVIFGNPDILNFDILKGIYSLGDLTRQPTLLLGEARLSSASIMLGSMFMGAVYLIQRLSMGKKTKAVIYGIFIAVIVLVPVLFTSSVVKESGFGHNALESQGDLVRPIVWRQGMEAFQDKPLLGYGPNNFEYAFQDTFDARVTFLKQSTNWFDKVHNSVIHPLVETGILGTIVALAIFALALGYSFRFYYKNNDIVPILLVGVLCFNFVQTLTSFNTATSIMMIFTVLAYIVSTDPSSQKISLDQAKSSVLFIAGTVVIILFVVSSVIVPMHRNHKVITAMASGVFEERIEAYELIGKMRGDSAPVLRSITEKFVKTLLSNIEQFNNLQAKEVLGVEFRAIFDAHEVVMDKYESNYRHLVNYANMIHVARIFEVDETDRSGILIEKALEISTDYPQALWMSSLQAFYTDDKERAIEQAGKAIALFDTEDPLLSAENIDTAHNLSLSLEEFVIKTPNIRNKVYFHLTEI